MGPLATRPGHHVGPRTHGGRGALLLLLATSPLIDAQTHTFSLNTFKANSYYSPGGWFNRLRSKTPGGRNNPFWKVKTSAGRVGLPAPGETYLEANPGPFGYIYTVGMEVGPTSKTSAYPASPHCPAGVASLTFSYHMYGHNIGTLHVYDQAHTPEAYRPPGYPVYSETRVWSLSHDTGMPYSCRRLQAPSPDCPWQTATVDLGGGGRLGFRIEYESAGSLGPYATVGIGPGTYTCKIDPPSPPALPPSYPDPSPPPNPPASFYSIHSGTCESNSEVRDTRGLHRAHELLPRVLGRMCAHAVWSATWHCEYPRLHHAHALSPPPCVACAEMDAAAEQLRRLRGGLLRARSQLAVDLFLESGQSTTRHNRDCGL